MSAPSHLRRSLVVLVAAATAVLVAVVGAPVDQLGAAPAEAATSPSTVPTLDWATCPGTDPATPVIDQPQCAQALVPLDHDRPDGELVAIALTRMRATGTPEERIGTLFIDPGGPGASGTDFADYEAESLTPEVRRAFDVVGFDPRGVRDSLPAPVCPPAATPSTLPDDADTASWRTFVDTFTASSAAAQASCAVANAGWISHAGTVAVAKDLDLLRQAVGDEQLTYHGISYGTRLGSVYAQLFPGKVRAMILDGNMDPFGDVPSFYLRGPASDDAFAAFRTWNPTAAQQFDEVLAALAGGPVAVPGGQLDAQGFRAVVSQSLGSEGRWPVAAATIEATHRAVVLGESDEDAEPNPDTPEADFGRVAFDGDDDEAGVDEPSPVFWTVMCQDNPARPSAASYAQAAAGQVASAPLFGFLSGAMTPICAQSAVPVQAIPRPAGITGPPMLVVQSRHDPQTPYEWGVAMLGALPAGSRMVVYEGATHGMYAVGSSSCVTAVGDAYLLDGTLPADTVSCPFVPPTT
jgi:pimeloyl-ACP methyl ester carboxylesterase